MKLFTKLAGGLALLTVFTLTSCEKEEAPAIQVVHANGVTITLEPEGGGESKSFTISNPYNSDNGQEYGSRVQEDIVLKPNTTYNATVTFFSDKTGTRKLQNEDIKKEEGVYTVTYEKGQGNPSSEMRADLSMTVTDKKADGSPLGLTSRITTGKAGIEGLKINLDAKKIQGDSRVIGDIYSTIFFVDVKN